MRTPVDPRLDVLVRQRLDHVVRSGGCRLPDDCERRRLVAAFQHPSRQPLLLSDGRAVTVVDAETVAQVDVSAGPADTVPLRLFVDPTLPVMVRTAARGLRTYPATQPDPSPACVVVPLRRR